MCPFDVFSLLHARASWAWALWLIWESPLVPGTPTLGWPSLGRWWPPFDQLWLAWGRWIIHALHFSIDLFIRPFAHRNEDLHFCKLSNWRCWKTAIVWAQSHLLRHSEVPARHLTRWWTASPAGRRMLPMPNIVWLLKTKHIRNNNNKKHNTVISKKTTVQKV